MSKKGSLIVDWYDIEKEISMTNGIYKLLIFISLVTVTLLTLALNINYSFNTQSTTEVKVAIRPVKLNRVQSLLSGLILTYRQFDPTAEVRAVKFAILMMATAITATLTD